MKAEQIQMKYAAVSTDSSRSAHITLDNTFSENVSTEHMKLYMYQRLVTFFQHVCMYVHNSLYHCLYHQYHFFIPFHLYGSVHFIWSNNSCQFQFLFSLSDSPLTYTFSEAQVLSLKKPETDFS